MVVRRTMLRPRVNVALTLIATIDWSNAYRAHLAQKDFICVSALNKFIGHNYPYSGPLLAQG